MARRAKRHPLYAGRTNERERIDAIVARLRSLGYTATAIPSRGYANESAWQIETNAPDAVAYDAGIRAFNMG